MSVFSQFVGGGRIRSQEFSSSGTFTVPAGVTTVWVTMCGGGGSGAVFTNYNRSAGGGAGSYCIKRAITVTPGAGVTVTIGGGGAGITGGGSQFGGNQGSTTSFGSVSVSGGYGGYRASNIGSSGEGGSNGGYSTGSHITPAGSIGGLPGRFDPSNNFFDRTGGGGGGLFGNGTDGRFDASSSSAPANSGAGSGGVSEQSTVGYSSGSGGSGRCIVEWFA